MFTLQDYLTMTKGQEYLIAIASMFAISLFWVILNKGNQKDKK